MLTVTTKTPSEWADAGDAYDCTMQIGPLDYHQRKAEWPMYSFDRPACILWNAIAAELYKAGWSDKQIKEWLQSKSPRWALDQSLGDALQELGARYAKQQILGVDR